MQTLVYHGREFGIYPLAYRQPMKLTEIRRNVIMLTDIVDHSSGRILHTLQSLQQTIADTIHVDDYRLHLAT